MKRKSVKILKEEYHFFVLQTNYSKFAWRQPDTFPINQGNPRNFIIKVLVLFQTYRRIRRSGPSLFLVFAVFFVVYTYIRCTLVFSNFSSWLALQQKMLKIHEITVHILILLQIQHSKVKICCVKSFFCGGAMMKNSKN